ncbi:DUF3307 domain-containing protein [Halanaerobacter jeridensis]|uniref:DUF3307 domain-containing protein n=1 Tax=Halanaerobacter jeridensis TaxID=706427 RepID=A0A938XPK6_9FIRM|nr:DUF3307 domain-containing protein [Halanaerobacter jeridensis]MBM7556737.1 hypothetical protein [Halanaerobacter jeridensis]
MSAKIVISLLILGHLLNDFVLQSRHVAYNKGEDIKLLIQHCVSGIVVSIILTWYYLSWWLIGIEILIYVFHFVIDGYKTKLRELNWGIVTEVRLFIIDQLAHLIVITATYPLLKLANISLEPWGEFFNNQVLFRIFPIFDTLNLGQKDLYIMILTIIAYVFVWRPASFLVDKILLNLKEYASEDEEEHNLRELIAKLERTILLTLVLSHNFLGLVIVFAAKSVACFDNFSKKSFASYYIVGSLSSLLIAIVIGTLLNLIIYLEGYQARFIIYKLF